MSIFRCGKVVTIERFENIFVKSLPTSLACPRQEKDGQREEISLPPFVKGD
jgi:hypothetical protein